MDIFLADEQDEVEVDRDRLVRLARSVLTVEKLADRAELSIICVDEKSMTELNKRFLGIEGPTDVLAFPMDGDMEPEVRDTGPGGRIFEPDEEPLILGDVVLCPAIARRQAVESGTDLKTEMDLLFVHGFLHLLGFDHGSDEEAEMMEARELDHLRAFSKTSKPE